MHAMYIFAWGKKKEEETAFRWYMVPKRVVEVFFFFSFFPFHFWFLVFVFGFFTVALLAWRVVFFFVSGGHWVGLGWGSLYNMGESFALDYNRYMYLFFIDEMAGGGMERGGWLV